MKKNKISLIVLSLILVAAVAGCGTNGRMGNMSTQARLPNNANNRWMNDGNTNNRLNTSLNNGRRDNLNNGMLGNDLNLNNGMVRNNTNSDLGMINNNNLATNNNNLTTNTNNLGTRANAIAKRVAALPEVESASVLINGNTAVVGCNLSNNNNRTISSNLKQKIDAAVKVADRNIETIQVTADPNINTRIKNMNTRINNGNPISGFATEVEDIIRRITAPIR
ncbi:YhcN/YlaJ family sporulation lipoprotein [Tissierella sp.]|uniref:YhcN/YlaJ family sporulation lipoprotein n=1 Tax=Tissierella sp. TaxID=41274 RepID=UPI00286569A7|nr:YhcN/YlaJ family sporulation lipoprotein [Tissierella sp.]MDR7856011.1 YhcN/YlaJ family sporulation lipoprotein [Tissierella sp.]